MGEGRPKDCPPSQVANMRWVTVAVVIGVGVGGIVAADYVSVPCTLQYVASCPNNKASYLCLQLHVVYNN